MVPTALPSISTSIPSSFTSVTTQVTTIFFLNSSAVLPSFGSSDSCLIPSATLSLSISILSTLHSISSPFLNLFKASDPFSSQLISDSWIIPSVLTSIATNIPKSVIFLIGALITLPTGCFSANFTKGLSWHLFILKEILCLSVSTSKIINSTSCPIVSNFLGF